MAVYTEVSDEALKEFLALYDLGDVALVQGHRRGGRKLQFLLRTTRPFILTLYEKRVDGPTCRFSSA